MNVGFPALLGGQSPAVSSPQALGFFKVRDVIWTSNLTLPTFTVASFLYAAAVGDTFLIVGQTDKTANGPYVVTDITAGVATIARHPAWATGSTQDITTAFVSYDGDTWPGIVWRCMATVAGTGTFVVGTNDAPFYPQKSYMAVAWTLSSGTKTQTHHPVLGSLLNPLGRFAGFSTAVLTVSNASLTVFYAVTSTAGVNGSVTVTAKKADGTTNTADTSTLSVVITNF